jgi:transcriptional regulator with PAS, ATPase and Fis domain
VAKADGGTVPGAGESPDFGFKNIIGTSRPIRDAIDLARRVSAARRTTVLLVGETGTGKELFARGIHYSSAAAHEPFVAINCAAIPETLLESELFGHEKGAFTGAVARKHGLLELAGSGSIFLDEIHQLPQALQPKLLRALESRAVRRLGGFDEIAVECRVIAAAGTLLEQVVASGEFREDLFYRLNVFSITIPPLRDRVEDIEAIANFYLEHQTREYQGQRKFSEQAMEAMRNHRWPGNVRELRNVVERAAILSGDARSVQPEHLMIQRRSSARSPSQADGDDIRIPREGKSLAEIEREAVRITLRMTGGNQAAAARLLRISRPTLAKKMNEARNPEPVHS